MNGAPPRGGLRAAALAGTVLCLLLASFWPLGSGWRRGIGAGKWEVAWLELCHPLFSVSSEAKRSVLEAGPLALRPGREVHLVVTRGADIALWVDGALRARLANPPPGPLLWSIHHRLCLGGAPDEPGPPITVRRVALHDRVLEPAEIRTLAASGAGPAPLYALDLALAPRPDLALPAGAAWSALGLELSGAPACSTDPLREPLERIRAAGEFSLELRWRPLAAGAAGPLVALAGTDGTRNLQVGVAGDRIAARVRAGYASRRRVADFLLNVAAYVPLGFLVALGRRDRRGIALALCAGLALSLGVEALQTFRDDRVPSLIDLGTNACGALVGGVLARWVAGAGGPAPGLARRFFRE